MSRSQQSRMQRARSEQRQRAADRAREDSLERIRRRQRLVGIGVVAAVVLGTVGVVFGATSSSQRSASTTTTSTATLPTPSTVAPRNDAPPAELPPFAPGATLTGATPCPAPDGSSPRTTRFEQPPPMCIDPAKEYTAVLRTTKGDVKVFLDAEGSPATVNNFVVLSRYRYYDGMPITRIVPRGWMEFNEPRNGDEPAGPGYSLPREGGPQAATPLMMAMVPDADGSYGGAFLLGIADQSPGIPEQATPFGTILDDRARPPDQSPTVRQEIDAVATTAGPPSEVVTITDVEISETTPTAS
jgi:cyclophilin family peptidyl-prolyl cis-trans isomerase